MSRPWVYPCVIIALLLLALAFRWDYKATKNAELYVAKWKVDRWTGQTWAELYSPNCEYEEFPDTVRFGPYHPTERDEAAWSKRHTLTRVWNGLLVFSVIWLLYAAWLGPSLRRRRLLNQENDVLQAEVASKNSEPQPATTSPPEPIREPIHETITCHHCKKEYNPWKCPNCKTELEPADEELETVIAVICPLCKDEYNPWVCPFCGKEAEQKTSDQISSNKPPVNSKKEGLGKWGIVFFIWLVIDSFGRRFITIHYTGATFGSPDEVLVYRNLFSAVFWALLPLLIGIKTNQYLIGFGGLIITMFLGCVVNIVGMLVAIGSSYYMLTQERRIDGEEYIQKYKSGVKEDGSQK